MPMKRIFMPSGLALHPSDSLETLASHQQAFHALTTTALEQWNRAIREGFQTVGEYTSQEGDITYAVFVLHRRKMRDGSMTPRMRAAQAVANMDIALAAHMRAEEVYKATQHAAADDASPDALDAEREAEMQFYKAQGKVVSSAQKLVLATAALLDYGI